MKPCTRCHRHVRRVAAASPFCDAALPDILAPSPAAWSLGLALFAGPANPSTDNDESTGNPGETTTTTTSSTSTTGAPDPTTGIVGDGSSSTSLPRTTGCSGACTDSNESAAFISNTTGDDDILDGCDNWAQDCPAGDKCSAYADGGTSRIALKCVPVVDNPKQPGEPCMVEGIGVSGVDDCDLGAYCWNTNAENVGTCVALCTGTPEAASCDDPVATCAIYNNGVLNLCLPSCDPLAAMWVSLFRTAMRTPQRLRRARFRALAKRWP